MTTISRQNALFVAEDWLRVYEALQNIDFRTYDQDTLMDALINYVQVNYPDRFNDWIASSEFIMKVEILAWLSQNIAFRHDLNSRENFLATAERRESLLRLAYNIAYKVNRVRGASGEVKVISVKTTESITDSSDQNLQDREIVWNSVSNEDWFEQFILVLNSAFTVRNPYSKPGPRFEGSGVKVHQYRLNSNAPVAGAYQFSSNVSGKGMPFELVNCLLDEETGEYKELAPNPLNVFSIFHKTDGKGLASPGTGFFIPLKQGTLGYKDVDFTEPVINRSYTLNTMNVSNDDFFVQEIDSAGNVIAEWTKVDNVLGDSVAFNTLPSSVSKIYELDTLTDDRVAVRFGDGKFGAIPVGKFRLWFRTVNASPEVVKPDAIVNKSVTMPYKSNGKTYFLTMKYSLQDSLVNAARSETDLDIRQRANKVFFTGNRMVTGEDYNSFFLKDTAIKKVKTINRTFSGHSRFAKLNDPTGLYSNVKLVANDGRLYQSNTLNINYTSAQREQPLAIALNEFIRPCIRKEDKRILYYNRYNEMFVDGAAYSQTSLIGRNSRGNMKRNGARVPVGSSVPASDNLRYVMPNAVIRFDNLRGDVAAIERVVGDGTSTDGIIFRSVVKDGSTIISVMPPIRTEFTQDEDVMILTALSQQTDFGLTWNQGLQRWQLISYNNIDKDSEFSVLYQGDTSGDRKDASWMVYLEYQPGEYSQWKIVDRGLGIFFESARDVDFYFASSEAQVDPDTGRALFDNIAVLAHNESRDSLGRRGLGGVSVGSLEFFATRWVGDGVTTTFSTSQVGLERSKLIVDVDGEIQSNGIDYMIATNPGGDQVVFFTAPPANADIQFRVSDQLVYSAPVAYTLKSNGTLLQYTLPGVSNANQNNTFLFLDGIFQTPGIDYAMSDIGTAIAVLFDEPIPSDVEAFIYTAAGIDTAAYVKTTYVGDGVTSEFAVGMVGQKTDALFVAVDGVVQAPSNYGIATYLPTTDNVIFETPPAEGVHVVIYAPKNGMYTKTKWFEFDSDGATLSFALPGMRNLQPSQIMVFMDGVCQSGPLAQSPTYTLVNGNTVAFSLMPNEGVKIAVYVIAAVIGGIYDVVGLVNDRTESSTNLNQPANAMVTYMGTDAIWRVNDALRHDDGYTNPNGLFVIPADADRNGFYDRPFLFKDIVLMDGRTDLVLWQRKAENNVSVWSAINKTTRPRGTYESSALGGIKAGDLIQGESQDADVHYDLSTNTWLIANGTNGKWEIAVDQTQFRKEIGRDHLSFCWTHYSPDTHRIDPSVSNVMDCFILTSTYYEACRQWLANGARSGETPVAPTPEALRLQFADFNDFKMQSDSIIFYPARFKMLFGPLAIPELRGTFKVIKSEGSKVSDNDLKLRILSAIDSFFEVDQWEFGKTFYLTELIGYIHRILAPDVQSIVIVPKDSSQAFGRMFQIRAEPDELFMSTATLNDIELVAGFTDSELRIGSF